MSYTNGLDNPEEHFNVVLFTGDGSNNRSITVGFQPDITWVKQYTDASGGYLVDSVRGNNSAIQTTNTNAQGTFANMTFETNGITVSGNENLNNEASHNYVSWHWKKSSTSGIDVVQYTGNGSANRSISHSLGTEPDFIITKIVSESMNWPMYSKASGNGVAFLDINDAWTDHSSYLNYWYISGMGSSTFGVGDNDNTNKNTATVISYLFSNRQGFSRAGVYTGNGSSSAGQFCFTGFKPAFVLIKKKSGSNAGMIADNERLKPFNPIFARIMPPETTNHSTGQHWINFFSNGFQTKDDSGENTAWNQSGQTYMYLAFAESPFVNSKGVPNNAR